MKKAIRCISFVLVFLCTFYFVNAVMKFKYEDGIQTLDHYYDLPSGTVDVLLAGSSHIGMNVDPGILWDEYGIAAYNLWGGFQPAWNTYYYIKEGLAHQTPRVVVMDVYLLCTDLEYSDYSGMVKNTIAMSPSLDRAEATRVSTTEDLFATVLLGWPTYHGRYAELTEQDFDYFFWDKHTGIQRHDYGEDSSQPVNIIDTAPVTGRKDLFPKQAEYFYKIIELCAEKGVALQLISSPFELSEEEQMRFNTVADIAAENGISFVNYNENALYQEAGILTGEDFRDPGHLNMDGIEKYTKHLGGWLKQTYHLPDHRGDAGHIWRQQSGSDDKSLVYRMPELFVGDGERHCVDTGVRLYENALQSWTLKAEIDTHAGASGDKVYFSCFSEDPEDYRGLMVRRINDTISVVVGNVHDYRIRDFGDSVSITIVKEQDAYSLYVDGTLVESGVESRCPAYAGNLLLGCQETFEGEKFRFSETTTYSLEVYDKALSASRAAQAPERAPEKAPDIPGGLAGAENLLYRLPHAYDGDPRGGYVNTGVPLYDEADKSYSLLCEISPEVESSAKVYLSCFSEEEGNMRGLLVRKNDSGTLSIIYGGNWAVEADIPEAGNTRLAVVKNVNSYTIYVNGEVLADNVSIEVDPFDGNLLVGAQQTPDGEIFRESRTTVAALEVYDGAISRADVESWKPEMPPAADYPKPDSPNYTMDDAFLGDGVLRYVDAGVRLYDDPQKSWTLTMDVEPDRGGDAGVYASCFNEKNGDYYGLIVRQYDADTIEIITGRSRTAVTLADFASSINLTIVKNNYSYDIYVDGVLHAGGIASECPVYDGNLLVGCQEDANGGKFRFGRVKVRALQLSDSLWTQQQIADFINNREERPGRGW